MTGKFLFLMKIHFQVIVHLEPASKRLNPSKPEPLSILRDLFIDQIISNHLKGFFFLNGIY